MYLRMTSRESSPLTLAVPVRIRGTDARPPLRPPNTGPRNFEIDRAVYAQDAFWPATAAAAGDGVVDGHAGFGLGLVPEGARADDRVEGLDGHAVADFADPLVAMEHVPRVRERMNDQTGQDLWSDRMCLELKRSDDAKVATTTTNSPEEIGIFTFADLDQLSSRGHDVRRDEVVDRQAVLPAEPAEPATEGKAGDSRRRIYPYRRS